jgi:phenylalanyl-tRNA synthetase beta chain
MKLPMSWLAEFVDLAGITAKEVADGLASSKFVVEKIEDIGPEVTGPVVVGRILEIYPHPNADRIRLTKTKVDEQAEPLEIVCGAHNIEVGQVIPVALPGAKVVNRHDGTELAIKLSKIRGVQSNGMLCSPAELGITDGGGDGILILNDGDQLTLGADLKDRLARLRDVALTVVSSPNREAPVYVSDVAQEVATSLGRAPTLQSWKTGFPSVGDESYSIKIDDFNDCELYTVRPISNLKVSPAPLLIKRRIEALAMKSTNNIVDIINSVMFEYGQPLQAYDAALIEGKELKVRRGLAFESLRTVDGSEYPLGPGILVVSDGRGAISIAGIAGSINAAISDGTTTILLEAAKFSASNVDSTRELLRLDKQANDPPVSTADLTRLKLASNRAAFQILKHCAGAGAGQAGAFCAAERQLAQ